jgi:hypothetical protein
MASEHDCGKSMGYHQNHVVISAVTTGASGALWPRRPGSFKIVASTLLLVTQQKQNPLPAAFQLQSNSQLCPQKPNLLLNPTARDHTNILKLKLLIHYKQKKKPFQLGETTRFLQLSK